MPGEHRPPHHRRLGRSHRVARALARVGEVRAHVLIPRRAGGGAAIGSDRAPQLAVAEVGIAQIVVEQRVVVPGVEQSPVAGDRGGEVAGGIGVVRPRQGLRRIAGGDHLDVGILRPRRRGAGDQVEISASSRSGSRPTRSSRGASSTLSPQLALEPLDHGAQLGRRHRPRCRRRRSRRLRSARAASRTSPTSPSLAPSADSRSAHSRGVSAWPSAPTRSPM